MNKYLHYLKNEAGFFLALIPYLLRHPQHLTSVIRYGKRDKEICLENKLPWLNFLAIDWLKKNLNPEMTILEWGSGGSTIFLSLRTKTLVSVEHNQEWYNKVLAKLEQEKISNCEYLLPPNYCDVIRKYPDHHFDLVLIDGENRNECITEARSKVKPNGVIILDNSERREYESGINQLSAWKRKDWYGPGPYNHYFWQTSLFVKPQPEQK